MVTPEQGILLGFSTPRQGGKFKMPVAHARLIKLSPPPPLVEHYFETRHDHLFSVEKPDLEGCVSDI